jgi:ABC-type glycerol-3-phosphate transport system substrate-binding protein
MSNFQTILVAVFLAFFVFAVLIFSGILKLGGSSSTENQPKGKVVVWGTFNNPELFRVFQSAAETNQDLSITYIPKAQSTYEQTLIEAFANGTGPDLFMITPEMVERFENFIYKIPYVSYASKTYKDAFVDGADVYLSPDGVVGFPIVIDPMVMYYNRDLLSNEGLSTPPQYWDELFDVSSKLTKKTNDGTILQSMIALGRYDNVTHAKDILATLLLQNGNPIIKRAGTGYTSVLSDNPVLLPVAPFETILDFFTEFSNPSNNVYSWNRALPESIDMFTGGKLAFYLGRASELFKIESVNPNLSFDVTGILQTRNTNTKRTYGSIYAVAVNKKSPNVTTAFSVAGMLSGNSAKDFAAAVSLPPATRALLQTKPTDPYLFTFFNSAITTRTWLDPDSTASDNIFNELIENILSNRLSISDAISKAQSQLELITKK